MLFKCKTPSPNDDDDDLPATKAWRNCNWKMMMCRNYVKSFRLLHFFFLHFVFRAVLYFSLTDWLSVVNVCSSKHHRCNYKLLQPNICNGNCASFVIFGVQCAENLWKCTRRKSNGVHFVAVDLWAAHNARHNVGFSCCYLNSSSSTSSVAISAAGVSFILCPMSWGVAWTKMNWRLRENASKALAQWWNHIERIAGATMSPWKRHDSIM